MCEYNYCALEKMAAISWRVLQKPFWTSIESFLRIPYLYHNTRIILNKRPRSYATDETIFKDRPVDIVRHMQSLSLLCPSSEENLAEKEESDQIQYLSAALELVSNLNSKENLDEVAPMYNLFETYSESLNSVHGETSSEECTDVQWKIILENSATSTEEGLFCAASLLANKKTTITK